MGLYNTVFGENDFGRSLIGILYDVQAIDVGRYRDAWIEDAGGKFQIRIHTRNGDGNRADYTEEIESMQAHPWYDRDVDDDFDSTYADFYFDVPDELDPKLRTALQKIAVEPVDMRARWQKVIEALRNA